MTNPLRVQNLKRPYMTVLTSVFLDWNCRDWNTDSIPGSPAWWWFYHMLYRGNTSQGGFAGPCFDLKSDATSWLFLFEVMKYLPCWQTCDFRPLLQAMVQTTTVQLWYNVLKENTCRLCVDFLSSRDDATAVEKLQMAVPVSLTQTLCSTEGFSAVYHVFHDVSSHT